VVTNLRGWVDVLYCVLLDLPLFGAIWSYIVFFINIFLMTEKNLVNSVKKFLKTKDDRKFLNKFRQVTKISQQKNRVL